MAEPAKMEEFLIERKRRSALASAKQRQASDPDKSVWVEASAGTGKTKVLSDRVLRLLLKGVAPARILCLTYTKAAAVEMSTRIAGRLSRWAVAEDEVLEKELEALLGFGLSGYARAEEIKAAARKLFAVLLDTPGGMKIQTIHSFCQEILKRFPLEAKISPYFEVMDDRTAAEAVEEVKAALLKKIEEEPESRTAQALAFLTAKVSEFTFPKIMTSLTANRNKIAVLLGKYDNLEDLIRETAEKIGVAEDDSREGLLEKYFAAFDDDLNRKIMDGWFHGSDSDKKKAETLSAILESADKAPMFEDYKLLFLKQDGEIRKSQATKSAAAYYSEIAEACLHIAESLQELNNRLCGVGLFESTRAVLYLADDLIAGYNRYKHLHSKMDYEDLIVLTRRLLENKTVADWVLFKLDGGIDNVLIDEAQDTSPDQWAIVKAVTEDFFSGSGAKENVRTVFAVGDRKQSIYSFQGADPREFENMRRHFTEKSKALGNFEEVQLDVSFRSTAAILDTVNNVFSHSLPREGVAAEGRDITHTPSRIGDGGRVELWPLVEAEEGENPDVWLPPVERKTAGSTSSRLARQIAERIKKMVDGGEILASQNRPVRYADFMVLVQRRNSFVEELVRECKNVNVSIAGVDKIKLLEQIAIQDLVALAKFILLPTDDLTLATVLKSPLFNLNDDDLFRLCYNRGGATVWARLGSDEKYKSVYRDLQELLNMADFVRPFELYAHVLNKLEGRRKFVARLGYEAADGIDEFVNLTLAFEQEHVPSLQGFADWIAKDEVEIKRELEQSDIDAVRIMTVHGSKGLQAPIVILPDTVRVKNIKNEAGLLMGDVLYYPLGSDSYESRCKKIKEEEKALTQEEYHRLLYVALTRAEDRLCVCGYSKKNKPSDDSWYAICKDSFGELGTEQEDGSIVYEVAQALVAESKDVAAKSNPVLPAFDWLKKEAVDEGALARPLTPSKLDEDEEPALVSPIGEGGKSRYRRGQIIHKLLQFLPDARGENKDVVIEEFLRKNAADLREGEILRIKEEVLNLLQDEKFAAVFGAESKAEVPVMGLVNGKIISGQIDRLVVEKDRVMIIDFKTNRPAAQKPEDVQPAYVKQLRAYKLLIEKIYPEKNVETLILWTDTATLMEIF